jgi:uncharacterized protein involved in cysteine biosynthesis
MEIIILIIASFIWLINFGQKPINEILEKVDKYISYPIFKILQIFVILFIILLFLAVLGTVYLWIKKYSFSN